MKRTLSILIALLLCLFVFTGCDNVQFPIGDSQTTNDTADTVINSGDEFHEQVPHDLELNLEFVDGKFI